MFWCRPTDRFVFIAVNPKSASFTGSRISFFDHGDFLPFFCSCFFSPNIVVSSLLHLNRYRPTGPIGIGTMVLVLVYFQAALVLLAWYVVVCKGIVQNGMVANSMVHNCVVWYGFCFTLS